MIQGAGSGPRNWMQHYCPSMNGQFLFLNPISWETHLLSEGAVVILNEAADAIEERRFDAFLGEIAQAGEWPPGLEFLAQSLTTLATQGRDTAQA